MVDHCSTSSSAIIGEALSGSHVLKVDGYSQIKELFENGQYVESLPFSVAGHNWVIRFYPNGCSNEYADFVSVFLCLDSAVAKDVKVKFRFNLLDKNAMLVPANIYSIMNTYSYKGSSWGYDKFMKRVALQRSEHLRDDCFTIRCDVIIMKEVRRKRRLLEQFIVVPPSDLHQHFGNLLKNMDGTDVTFKVSGETFSAHRCVLTARSSVFKAELFGSMKERTRTHLPIEIHDMEGDVFKSLLHFIYTDSLPELPSDEARPSVVRSQHLLVAADRYNIERLKLLCEEKLCKHMDSNMVATTLVLAEQHNCSGLKEACFDFLALPSKMKAMMASDGYEHIQSSCPTVLKELITRSQPLDS